MATTANQSAHSYQPHLTIREYSVPPGREWVPSLAGWSLLQIGGGMGYWLQGQARTELHAGNVLLVAPGGTGRLLASQLNALALSAFTILPERLTGLMTLGEQAYLQQLAARGEFAIKVFAPPTPVATTMTALLSGPSQNSLSARLIMLQLLVEAGGHEGGPTEAEPEQIDAKNRLRSYLLATQPDTLLEVTFDELARRLNCTPRHLSRVFYDVVGMSFRDKRAEIRLARARDLLATTQSKVVEVALESGYKSLSLFNLMFTRHFGVSPGRWRQKNQVTSQRPGPRKFKPGKLVLNKTRPRLTW